MCIFLTKGPFDDCAPRPSLVRTLSPLYPEDLGMLRTTEVEIS